MKLVVILLGPVAALACAVAPARAVTLYSDLASWRQAVGVFSETTSLGVPSFAIVTSEPLSGGQTITSSAVTALGIGGDWATWSSGYTGQVVMSGLSNYVGTLDKDLGGLGFFAEPNLFDTFDMTLELSDGSTLSKPVAGEAGAAFFGWTGPGITSFTMSTDAAAAGFAIGDFFSPSGRNAPVELGMNAPDPIAGAPGPIVAAGLPGVLALLVGGLMWWRRKLTFSLMP